MLKKKKKEGKKNIKKKWNEMSHFSDIVFYILWYFMYVFLL